MIPLSHGKGVLWQQAANNRLQVHSTLRLSASALFAWHTRRCCCFQRWFERLRALTVHTTMLSRIDAITIFRFFGSLFIDTVRQCLDGSGCAGTQILDEGTAGYITLAIEQCSRSTFIMKTSVVACECRYRLRCRRNVCSVLQSQLQFASYSHLSVPVNSRLSNSIYAFNCLYNHALRMHQIESDSIPSTVPLSIRSRLFCPLSTTSMARFVLSISLV